jgi:GT2 family glycosyltransferase
MEETQTPPKVSVLIVSWNSASALRRCLDALDRSADREKIEIVVVDNGSLDESPRLDQEYHKINLLRLPRNFGFVKALNIGMRTGVGEFYFLLQPEMEVTPETVSTLAGRLEATPDAVAVSPVAVSPDGQLASRIRTLPSPPELYRAWRQGDFTDWKTPDASAEVLSVDYLKHSPLMVRANFLKGLRYIDERYGNSWWDLELCFQIRRVAKRILLLPGLQVFLHETAFPLESLDADPRALISADKALGASTFVKKHYGLAAGVRFRIATAFRAFADALLAVLRFKETRYHLLRFNYLLSGQKIDGSQRTL